jgi:serine protease Do
MLNQSKWIGALLLGCVSVSGVDVLRLKENAAIAGKILTEKPEQVVIDVGYTVLVVPRNQILDINSPSSVTATSTISADALELAGLPTAADKTSSRASVAPDPQRSAIFQEGDSRTLDRSVRELVTDLGEAVVQVRTPSGLGSGFIINPEGFLITNFHVIESETQISVEVYHQKNGQLDRRSYKQVRIVAMNKYADLALLRIEDKDAPRFGFVPLGDSDEMGVGERVFAVGSPLGLERTVTEGIVSTKTRPMQGELYLQTTTQINPGNSGGPLFNLRGEVVGVTNMKIAFGEGIGFAIPVHTVKYFLMHRDAYAYDTDNPSSPYHYLEAPSRISKSTLTSER